MVGNVHFCISALKAQKPGENRVALFAWSNVFPWLAEKIFRSVVDPEGLRTQHSLLPTAWRRCSLLLQLPLG